MFMLKGGENLVVFYMNAAEGLKHWNFSSAAVPNTNLYYGYMFWL